MMERQNIEDPADTKKFFKVPSSKRDPTLRRNINIWNYRHKLIAVELSEVATMESELVDQLKGLLDIFGNIKNQTDTTMMVKSLQDNIKTSQQVTAGCMKSKESYVTLLENKGSMLEGILKAKKKKF